jgi:hypothetical protein
MARLSFDVITLAFSLINFKFIDSILKNRRKITIESKK